MPFVGIFEAFGQATGRVVNEPRNYKAIMLSSTFTDLKEHRQRAIEVIHKFGYLPQISESSSPILESLDHPQNTIELCRQMVRDAAAYVGIIGFRYGPAPYDPEGNPNALSITELEFNEALERDLPIVIFVMGDLHPVTKADVDSDPESLRKLAAFRERLKGVGRSYETFESLEDFSSKIGLAIGNLVRRLEEPARTEAPNKARPSRRTRSRTVKDTSSKTIERPPSEPEEQVREGAATRDQEVAQKRYAAPFYSDHAARRDSLNRKAVAETVATMIENVWKEDAKEENIDRTFMVHLHGRWGSGKTSILNFLRDALLAQGMKSRDSSGSPGAHPSWIIVDYNAWRNQALGPAWWTLMETVYRQAHIQLGGWSSLQGARVILGDRWWRVRCSYAPYALAAVLSVAFGLFLTWIWQKYLFKPEQSWLVEGAKVVASAIGLIVAGFAFGHTYPVGSARTAKSYLELSRDPLSPLIKRYDDLIKNIGRPVAVFIDDLDRCNAQFVVELLQTVQTLFRQARVLYVVAADRDWVCASYQQQYKDFNTSIGEPGKSLGHLFLEKVFQLSVEVPRLNESERKKYWGELIDAQSLSGTEPPLKEQVDQVNQEVDKAQTESELKAVVDQYRNHARLGDIVATRAFQRMQSAPLTKEREHFLSDYAPLIETNPRAMKRLLNAYGFRRGFDLQSHTPSEPDALVRWTILENRWPVLADYLEGRSRSSEVIEALMKDKEVLKVAEDLTWEKLRPVASAPDQPPTPEITPGTKA